MLQLQWWDTKKSLIENQTSPYLFMVFGYTFVDFVYEYVIGPSYYVDCWVWSNHVYVWFY